MIEFAPDVRSPDSLTLPALVFVIVAAVSALEAHSPIVVTSWYRDPAHNAEVGGSDKSQHLIATAWDVRLSPDTDTFRMFAEGNGLHTVQEADHLHVQLYASGASPLYS